jgi:hypothetical protein
MAFVKVRVPRTSQPQDGGIGVEDLLGYPVFTILGNSITDSNGLTGSLVGTAKLSPNRYGIGVDSTVTAGDRLSFPYSPGRDLSADVPTTILLQFENNVWATGGLTNYIAGQSDSSSSTGHYEFSLADNVLSLTYRRNSGSDVTVTFGTLPAGIVTILLCRESSGTNGWRSYVNGVDFGYGNSNGYATSPFQGGGTNAFSIGSVASLGTRGLKGNFLLFHAATGKVIPASLGVDVTQSPASAWQVFKPEERLIWIPDAVSAGGITYTLTCSAGSYLVSGNAASFSVARRMTAGSGVYSVIGNAAALYYFAGSGPNAYALTASSGIYALSGNDSSLTHARAASNGAYALLGEPSGLAHARSLSASPGDYSLSGRSAVLAYTSIGPINYTLAAMPGVYVAMGGDVNFAFSGAIKGGGMPPRKKFYVETLSGVVAVDSLIEASRIINKIKKTAVVPVVTLGGIKVEAPVKKQLDYAAIEIRMRAEIQAEIDDEEDLLMLFA